MNEHEKKGEQRRTANEGQTVANKGGARRPLRRQTSEAHAGRTREAEGNLGADSQQNGRDAKKKKKKKKRPQKREREE
jgi:hypothetical protein